MLLFKIFLVPSIIQILYFFWVGGFFRKIPASPGSRINLNKKDFGLRITRHLVFMDEIAHRWWTGRYYLHNPASTPSNTRPLPPPAPPASLSFINSLNPISLSFSVFTSLSRTTHSSSFLGHVRVFRLFLPFSFLCLLLSVLVCGCQRAHVRPSFLWPLHRLKQLRCCCVWRTSWKKKCPSAAEENPQTYGRLSVKCCSNQYNYQLPCQ